MESWVSARCALDGRYPNLTVSSNNCIGMNFGYILYLVNMVIDLEVWDKKVIGQWKVMSAFVS